MASYKWNAIVANGSSTIPAVRTHTASAIQPWSGEIFLVPLPASATAGGFSQPVRSFSNSFFFIYLGFYVAFNTVQVISRRVVGRAEETSTYSSSGVLYCKLPTNGKQLPAFPLQAVTGIEPRTAAPTFPIDVSSKK